VLEWKFNSLDVNGDLILSRDEYWALRELVKKVLLLSFVKKTLEEFFLKEFYM
jgi:hypothetical protein